jgi:methionyl-tRNA synthetase
MEALELSQALGAVWDLVGEANRYLVERAPWALAKDEAKRDELSGVLYASAETLRILAILTWPILPLAAQRLWEQLGGTGSVLAVGIDGAAWGLLQPGTTTRRGDSLFPRLDQ